MIKKFGFPIGAVLALLVASPALAHPHACCLPDGECVEVLTLECFAMGGAPCPLETPCSDVVCPITECRMTGCGNDTVMQEWDGTEGEGECNGDTASYDDGQ